jgi:hypothetical protein
MISVPTTIWLAGKAAYEAAAYASVELYDPQFVQRIRTP